MTIHASSSAPGKAILFGEHAVVYGITAIAVALSDLRIRADVTINDGPSKTLYVCFDDIKSESGEPLVGQISFERVQELLPVTAIGANLPSPINPPQELQALLQQEFESYPSAMCQGMMASTYLFGHILLPTLLSLQSPHNSVSIRVKSAGLPIGAGLGSSAAFAVAVSGALMQAYYKLIGTKESVEAGELVLTQDIRALINSWAYAGEVLIHGNPSGLDNTTSCFGGMVKFRKLAEGNDFEIMQRVPVLDILLTNTKVPRSTKVLVAGVRKLHDTFPKVVSNINASIQAITDTFLERLEQQREGSEGKFIEELNALLNLNHALLVALGVSHPALEEVQRASAKHGCGSKLTGAGGGGCAITLLGAGTSEVLVEDLTLLGFEVMRTKIGGGGVEWH